MTTTTPHLWVPLLLLMQVGGMISGSAQTDPNTASFLRTPPTLTLQLPKPLAPAPIPSYSDPAAAVMRALIISACMRSDLKQAAYLLAHGAPINARGKDDDTPLIIASMRSPDMVKLLLAHKPDLELKEVEGYTALGAACWTSQTDCGKLLIDAGANLEALNLNGHPPLLLAVEEGDDDLVQALIDHHVDVNQATEDGSAIWWAIGQDRPRELAMLLAAGADFQPHMTVALPPDKPAYTVIAKAAMGSDTSLIDMLLAHGANLNEPDTIGRTPLMMAIKYSKVPMVLYLLQKGADMTKVDGDGRTALVYAVQYQDEPVWQALLQHGAVIDAKDRSGRTALSYAGQDEYLACVRWLIDKGADANAADAQGNTPLQYAGDRGGTEVMKLLRDHGARPVDLHIIARPMPSPALPVAHQWALATTALYVQWNGLNPHVLGGGEEEHRAGKALQDTWRIHDRKSLERMVDYLQRPGERQGYQRTGKALARIPDWMFWLSTLRASSESSNETKAIRQNYLAWQGRSGLAGDLCRAAFLVQQGYSCHYIDEDEAWSLLLPIARNLQAQFESWHEMCDNFLDAREMWTGKADPELDACGDLLCNDKDPNSPWNYLPWQTDLSAP